MEETKQTTKVEQVSLRTAADMTAVHERTASGLLAGTIDPRTANSITAVVAGARKVQIELPLKYMKMYLDARANKVSDLPKLPEGMLSVS